MNLTLLIAAIPLILLAPLFIVPSKYIEPYTYWDAAALNSAPPGQRVPRWRNMGYWEHESMSFTQANQALAEKLLNFADAHQRGSVLEIAHGCGESLLIHLQSTSPPRHLHALTSLESETNTARALVAASGVFNTSIEWFTASASLRPGKDLEHPLNPLRGFMGEHGERTHKEWNVDTIDQEDEGSPGPPPYDLVYVLDGIYHFPPSVPYFTSTVLPVLRPSSGVLVFTDILPPADMSPLLGYILGPILSVPVSNLVNRPGDLSQYANLMQRIGYNHVQVEDWSPYVWDGLSDNMGRRGGVWRMVGKVIGAAGQRGWKFIAVRASRPGPSIG